MNNYTQNNKLTLNQKLAAFMLIGLILISGFAGIYPIKVQGNFLPATPPITLPITPPIPTTTPIIPTPTATPTPILPISPPIINQNPVILTDSLKPGIINRYYRAEISGFDQDYKQILTMKISQLPPGFRELSCKKGRTLQGSFINCQISGMPIRAGTFPIKIVLKDNQGGISQKTINLRIEKTVKIHPGFGTLLP